MKLMRKKGDVILGFINPFAGAAYAVIDAYIATKAKPC